MEATMEPESFQASRVALHSVHGPPTGRPLLLLHGLFDFWRSFTALIPALTSRWEVHAFDMRGHGQSGRAPAAYRPADYVQDAEEFLLGRMREPAVLLGHSGGALCALWLAARQPERVRAVIAGDLFASSERLASLVERPRSVAFHAALREIAGAPVEEILATSLAGELDGAVRRLWAESISALDPDTLAYHATGDGKGYLEGIDMATTLEGVRCPVFLIAGDPSAGGVMTPPDIRFARSRLTESSLEILKGTGHDLGLMGRDARRLMTAVADFLDGL
jgi:pimeloyl-ACP methyl ester carboxylesterase